jgi:hypothetical protein
MLFESKRFGVAPRPALNTFRVVEFARNTFPPSDRVKPDDVGRCDGDLEFVPGRLPLGICPGSWHAEGWHTALM